MTASTFELLSREAIPALRLELFQYHHPETGARHLHLASDDDQNAFLVAFLTAPEDSTGVAHILEHTVLCGSRRYPVRDPFFMMTRRSLNTFMNAFTASDWTAYPFATQNEKDFYNLMDVYLDAAFFPLLQPLDFAQEGHRLEFEVADDPTTPLVRKGVVYNEMKGKVSSPVSVLAYALNEALFPSTTYHYNSGGDPRVIPQLSWEQLRAFHARHYHPANAIFMTWGNLPAERHQQRFEAQVLSQFRDQPKPQPVTIADEVRLQAPQQVIASYPVERDDQCAGKSHVAIAWLLGRNSDAMEMLRCELLSDLLLDNSASPLRRLLETCGLGSAPSPLCGFDADTRETTFACGLEGTEPERADEIEARVLALLEEVARDGVPETMIESVLHQFELGHREITGDGLPYGLRLMLDALAPTLHGGDPVTALDLDPLLEQLRAEAREPGFVQGLVRRLLLDNPHRVRVTLRPDPTLGPQREREEREQLEQLKAGLDAAARQQIVEQSAALKQRQAQHDDPELLPRVTLDDIPRQRPIAEGHEAALGDLPATWFAQGTNGMVYQHLILEPPPLNAEESLLFPRLCGLLTELGSGGRDYAETQALQARTVGAISVRNTVRGAVDDAHRLLVRTTFSAKALARNQRPMTELLRETFESVRFDEHSRMRELIRQARTWRESALTQHGHLHALLAAGASFSPVGALGHHQDGLAGLRGLQQLDRALEADAGHFADQLARLRDRLLDAPRHLLLVTEESRFDALRDDLAAIWQGSNGRGATGLPTPPMADAVNQGWAINSEVNFCARVHRAVAPGHADAPALLVLGEFLSNHFLHRAIREQGGAYGGGAGYHGDSATFRFYSYRDPRAGETLDDFSRAVDWLADHPHPAHSLEEAILGLIASIDKPGSPAGEAISAHHGALFGRTPAQRHAFRRQILAVTLDDLLRVGAHYLNGEDAVSAVVGPRSSLERLSGEWQIETV